MAPENKILNLVSVTETDTVARALRAWLATYPSIPLPRLDYEYLPETSGLALSLIQGAFKTKQYIDGSYEAQCQFKIVYRTIPTTADERIKADEELDAFGAWAEENWRQLSLGTGMRPRKLQRTTASTLFGRYEDGAEDHQISFNLLYEVI